MVLQTFGGHVIKDFSLQMYGSILLTNSNTSRVLPHEVLEFGGLGMNQCTERRLLMAIIR